MNTDTSQTSSRQLLGHEEWMELAHDEYVRLAKLITSFDAADWNRPTECRPWDVAAMVAHLLAAAESNASMREAFSQLRAARKWARENDGLLVDGLSTVQVQDRAHFTPADLALAYETTWPRALRGRSRMPGLVRKFVRIPGDTPGISERWTVGYLNDCIYTRDSWMHRVDLCRATSTELETSARHDGRIIADVADEWARRHGQPYSLELTGEAGGKFSSGTGGPNIRIDAVEFARTVSGRARGDGLLAVPVPF